MGQGAPEILAGLGGRTHVDIVRMLWPTGVLQDELKVSADAYTPLDEIDRRGSSCPVLFAWDGKKYQFITDVIGAGVVGHWISPTSQEYSRPGGMDQGGWDPVETAQRLPEPALRRAHGRGQFHRPTCDW